MSDPAWSMRRQESRDELRKNIFGPQLLIDAIRTMGVCGYETNFLKSVSYTSVILAETSGLLRFKGFLPMDMMCSTHVTWCLQGRFIPRTPHLEQPSAPRPALANSPLRARDCQIPKTCSFAGARTSQIVVRTFHLLRDVPDITVRLLRGDAPRQRLERLNSRRGVSHTA
jgi:hypothetical protein